MKRRSSSRVVRERGFVLHKLLEGVTGETADDHDSLAARAIDLIGALRRKPVLDPALGLSATEMGATAVRTMALPQIASIRGRLCLNCRSMA